MKYNQDKIIKLAFQFNKALENLDRLSGLAREVFLDDPDRVSSAKYNFLVAIEAIIDICNHIIAWNNLRPPEDYADTFRVMQEAGVFDGEFTTGLIHMAKFRNRLVHIYWEVDEELIYTYLQNNLKDLRNTLKQITGFLNGGEKPGGRP
ncbi:MAG: DUF86 domain-containing protein [Firmicutes bacterium]|nr:DUF86 domain-containing protein [Bacillota bacterium]